MTIKIIGLSVLTISMFLIGYIIGKVEGRKNDISEIGRRNK